MVCRWSAHVTWLLGKAMLLNKDASLSTISQITKEYQKKTYFVFKTKSSLQSEIVNTVKELQHIIQRLTITYIVADLPFYAQSLS
jgi:hypothetical protein